MANNPSKIKISHLSKTFGNKVVLSDVSLSIPAEQSLCIIGTSGCGKSVTLKCLLGLIAPDSGSIKIDDRETVGQSRSQREKMLRRFGMTFQFGALFDSLPIWQNITFRLRQNTPDGERSCRTRHRTHNAPDTQHAQREKEPPKEHTSHRTHLSRTHLSENRSETHNTPDTQHT